MAAKGMQAARQASLQQGPMEAGATGVGGGDRPINVLAVVALLLRRISQHGAVDRIPYADG